ncbi:siroheme synthase [Hydrogenovibrio marinus]|uniref:Siroheme synthase n=2 Tax=Hydrogenovibrio marinus TaxID=28885 RepID=A0A066ZLT0_HYDMR|nr:siroheme synthase [Hydrogenovibrio marinus]BBN59220.1 siroheme synthase 1 [Hydrogenovibrio marinus]
MDYLPIFVDLKRQPVLVVGGGDVALRKIRLLRQAGAQINLVAPQLCPDLEILCSENELLWFQGGFHPDQLAGMRLVIAATDQKSVNLQVFHAAELQGVPVNVVDDAELCRFILPAIIDRSPLMLAVSSGGHAPVLARQTREQLERILPQSLSGLGRLAQHNRSRVKSALPDVGQRRAFWEQTFRGEIARRVENNDQEGAQKLLDHKLQVFAEDRGCVSLVGAGPGDPELLTIKALQVMQQADVIVHDGLVSAEILELARRDAERISVAKKAGCHSMSQEEINQLLIHLAQQGLSVCRLKGGDPFIFGRGGEECEALKAVGIDYRIVPGISAAVGCAAYAGIPLTHRDYSRTVQLVTGHCKPGGEMSDWRALAQSGQTLVIYMGLIRSSEIRDGLLQFGRERQTPVAIIENGTLPQQRVVLTCLEELTRTVEAEQIKSPALLIVGEVCALAEKLAWWGTSHELNKDIENDAFRTA